ncbi:Sec-independent protein translocase protein TatB [Asticcacaulis excentricus]|uniref:Sec-independent protein translocase protein TatB n=1 Tax=Asticcacaulis excentricus (strain ATCC 15261 / DSM 4724 / KCTC 12464 / NCIMB 9791 / VKM B-1370 / CB 48) TaxID=573065 RepID=E8RP51_ASTEC|nr:Sec-independent protein translocase protein TatB [Asticcacaulis excentricus]ADU13021.1 twin-arginine translocation protein, TatB subunit [Asticcacaulis excentricus CB 48]
MLPGIGGSELVLIAVVALIVVGPKDLPKLLRQLGRFVAKMRSMADEFRTSFDDMARQSELDDLRKEVEALRSGNVTSPVIDDIREDMRRIEGEINDAIPPKGHYYSDNVDVPSPDAYDHGHTPADFGKPSLTDEPEVPKPAADPAIAEPEKKPRKPRAKKAAEAVENASVVAEAETVVSKPKRNRAKKTTETSPS